MFPDIAFILPWWIAVLLARTFPVYTIRHFAGISIIQIIRLAGEGGEDVAGGGGDDGDVCGGEAASIEADVLVGLECALEGCFACNGCEGHGLGFFYVVQYFN